MLAYSDLHSNNMTPHPAVHRKPSMSDTAFDTLGAARKLKSSGLGVEQADAIVEVMSQSASQFVTVERFDAGITMLQARIDGLQVRIDAFETGLNARIDAVASGLNTRIDDVASGLNTRIDAVESGLTARIGAVESGLNTRVDAVESGLTARIDAVRTDLRAEIWRSILVAVGVLIAANALMMTILGFVLTNGATPP